MYTTKAQVKLNNILKSRSAVVLAIESSCDDTGAAVVKDGRQVLSNVASSQLDVHRKYGGVVPEIASRTHIETLELLIEEALASASKGMADIDALAVTCGPGLVGALLVGVSAAKALAFALGIPLIGVNHMEGHLSAPFLTFPELAPPFMAVVVSGGHTQIMQVTDYCSYELIGASIDDAAGEALDKIARLIGLPYPGGPEIEKLALSGDSTVFSFTRPKTDGKYDFSFSGLKTAALNLYKKGAVAADLAASFQSAVVEYITDNAVEAAKAHNSAKLVLSGGVAANTLLRERLGVKCAKAGIQALWPDMAYCTDNAAMIGAAGYYRLLRGDISTLELNAHPSLRLI